MNKINSKEYWDNRFDSDWKDYNGNEQTEYFASILTSMLPEWLIHEINEYNYAICDLGCAEGDALKEYRKFFHTSEIIGEDFSEKAIMEATQKYPEFSYHVSDILSPEKEQKYPVIICSNVVEHFKETYKVMTKICERSTKYTVVMLPYREKTDAIEEHEKSFHTCDIFSRVEDNFLVYAKSMFCNSIYYPYEQLVLVYAKDKKFALLSEIIENVSTDSNLQLQNEFKKQIVNQNDALESMRKSLFDCEKKADIYKIKAEELEGYKAKYEEYESKIKELDSYKEKYYLCKDEIDKNKENTAMVGKEILRVKEELAQKCLELQAALEKDTIILQYSEKIENINKELISVQNENLHAQSECETLKIKLKDTETELKNAKTELVSVQNENLHAQSDCETLKIQLENTETELKNTKIELEKLENDIYLCTQNLTESIALLLQKDEYIKQAQSYCNHFATGKLMQLNHLLFRLKSQVIKGKKEDRILFRTWLKGRIKKTNRDIGEGAKYNPWMFINQVLTDALQLRYNPVQVLKREPIEVSLPVSEDKSPTSCFSNYSLSEITKTALQEQYNRHDVIILSVIDYDFRHQRPQHFATRFAENGHRVFYVNANFIRPDSVMVKSPNLYVVDFSCENYNAIYAMDGKSNLDWMKEKLNTLIHTWAIRDAVIVVDYPNWVYGAEYIRDKFGFKIATDYMDDYTGFLGTAEDFLKDNCIKLLKDSDIVIASSQFLYDVACKHTDADKITIIRNGTETEHFYQAVHMKKDKERKIIGYYGAVAHWFAWEKICYLAKTMPEYDIVIVGAVTEHREKLEKYQNIKLLGEKPYQELPKYLADFDVCLIPFDTSTDLIKATNPVKFYEYLSAGKKIVATEIPELMPYQDQYVYMSNDDKQFAEYVKMCLDGTDTLQGQEECIAFAKDNDWQNRFSCFSTACKKGVPMVSIIVLTYNNLELNKNCIHSILNQTAYANYELIIVDNQSTDGTVEYLHELQQLHLPNVTIILNDRNSGFAGGNNLGIQAAKGDYVLLLNNDTVVTRGWLTSMVKHLENNPKYGMCNPVTNSIGNESKIMVHYSNKQQLAYFAYAYTAEHMREEYKEVDRLPLFATMIKREVIEKAGLLDESYKIGMFEDDDYTERVLHAGYDIVIVEDAFIHHVNNASFKKLDDNRYKKIFEENKEIFEKKWGKKWTMPKYREKVTAEDFGCI